MNAKEDLKKLVSEVQMLRIRVAAAESKLKVMREQVREAKRCRKDAKRIAQSARKRFKQSKADLSELRKALASAEAKLFHAGGHALAGKPSQAKRTGQTRARKLVTAKAEPPSRRSTASGRQPGRTVAKRKPSGNRTVSIATRPDAVPEIATENQVLRSLPSITTGEPVLNATTEPL
jgi:hypothetical protein